MRHREQHDGDDDFRSEKAKIGENKEENAEVVIHCIKTKYRRNLDSELQELKLVKNVQEFATSYVKRQSHSNMVISSVQLAGAITQIHSHFRPLHPKRVNRNQQKGRR